MPYFSIIIPVYNVAPYLRKCLDSVLKQTFTDWEAVCVDDGSTDGSGAILDEYAAKDKRFRVFHQVNKGVNFVRQRALDASTGKWIASVDSDDWVGEDFLKNYAEVINSCDCDMIWTDIIRHYLDKSELESQQVEADPCKLQRAMMIGNVWGGNVNKCYSREFIYQNAVSFPLDQRVYVCEDLCFNVAFLSYKPKIQYLSVADYHYVLRDGSSIRTPMTYDRVTSMQYIDKSISNCYIGDDKEGLELFRKKELKSYAYCAPGVSNKEFAMIYPEITSLNDFLIYPHHKILFWLSTHRFRTLVLWMFRVVRWTKSSLRLRVAENKECD